MTKKIDNFLLGLLWLMTIALATTFWMNIKYGFNIFSSAHWTYLSELQAYRTDIKVDFYISLIVAIIVGLSGLYMLMRPRTNTFFIEPTQIPPKAEQPETLTQPNIIIEQPKPEPAVQPTFNDGLKRPMGPIGGRPAPIAQNRPHVNPPVTTPILKTTQQSVPESQHMAEIKSIFEDAGFIIKPCSRIAKLNNPIVALSYDQHLWIGIENATAEDVTDAIQTIVTVFEDTLGETADDITVHGCIIGSSEKPINPDLISTFDSVDAFRKFMTEHPNTKPEDYDEELFDAVSTYIGTVTNYIGKQ